MGERQGDIARFVVGLGNPGRKYAGTRHNAGFEVVERLARRWNLPSPRSRFDGLLYDGSVQRPGEAPRRVRMLTPQTYMNCSGPAVRTMADFHKAAWSDVLVVLDDMALPLGRLRARAEGSAGGHHGLEDVLNAAGTQAVPRLRIGIGSPPPGMDGRDFVLSRFAEDELPSFRQAVEQAASAVEDWVFHGLEWMMRRYNARADAEQP